MFTDEVWAHRGDHTIAYVTVKEDSSDRFLPENFQRKFSKLPAWMFWGSLAYRKKGPYVFIEKEWGNVNSELYNREILSRIEAFQRDIEHFDSWFSQDNAPSHRSWETRLNLARRRIR